MQRIQKRINNVRVLIEPDLNEICDEHFNGKLKDMVVFFLPGKSIMRTQLLKEVMNFYQQQYEKAAKIYKQLIEEQIKNVRKTNKSRK